MPKEYLVEFTERAQVAYQRLSNAVQRDIDRVLQRIEQVGLRSPNIAKIRGLPEKMYMARAGRNRIIFLREGDIFTILDIVSRDKIQRLSRLYDWDSEV